jgi:hypothetical protein
MSETFSEHRMAENEVIFREYNESVQKGFDELKKIAQEENDKWSIPQSDTPVHFYCECSDENCRERVILLPSRYAEIHKRRDRFVVIPGHQTKTIERVIHKETGYYVVEKLVTPPESASGLQKTDVNN